MKNSLNHGRWRWLLLPMSACSATNAFGGEADIKIPDLGQVSFPMFGGNISGLALMYAGLLVCAIGAIFGLVQYQQTKALPVHKTMRSVSNVIWETCKTYLQQQGKFLIVLWVLIAACMVYYFLFLQHVPFGSLTLILFCSILGILGSYGVAWFGIRINTVANSRTAFSAQSALRPRSVAIERANAAASFATFFRLSLSAPPESATGCAAPMLVAGASAATCAAMVMKTPADAARAPVGATYTTTGSGALSSR